MKIVKKLFKYLQNPVQSAERPPNETVNLSYPRQNWELIKKNIFSWMKNNLWKNLVYDKMILNFQAAVCTWSVLGLVAVSSGVGFARLNGRGIVWEVIGSDDILRS